MNRLIAIFVVVLSLSVLVSATVLAAPGDQVSPPGPINPAAGCTGIGVAYDGVNVLFTCAGSAAVYKTNTSGANLGSVATADSNGSAVQLDAIAWDASEGVLWGGDLGGNQCHIYSVDMSSGLATLRFSFADVHGGCGSEFFFYDGIVSPLVFSIPIIAPNNFAEEAAIPGHIQGTKEDRINQKGSHFNFRANPTNILSPFIWKNTQENFSEIRSRRTQQTINPVFLFERTFKGNICSGWNGCRTYEYVTCCGLEKLRGSKPRIF